MNTPLPHPSPERPFKALLFSLNDCFYWRKICKSNYISSYISFFFFRIVVDKAPLLVTMVRIGNYCVVDSTPEEESCGSASLLVAVTPSGCISTTKKVGGGAFQVINNLQGLGNAILTNNSK